MSDWALEHGKPGSSPGRGRVSVHQVMREDLSLSLDVSFLSLLRARRHQSGLCLSGLPETEAPEASKLGNE